MVAFGLGLKLIPVLGLLVWPLSSSPAAGDSSCRLAVLGDSLSAGYGVAAHDSFPAMLQRHLDADGVACTVLDAGVSGDTSAGGAARIDWLLADKPTHLLVELGGNDALRALPTGQLEINLESIVERAERDGVKTMLAGMLAPPNLGADYGEAFASVFTSLASRRGIPLYRFFLEGVAGKPDLLIEDGIHPNAAGIAEITRRIGPEIVAWIRG